jgi:formate/nitrite transporter FocA (FNT family)
MSEAVAISELRQPPAHEQEPKKAPRQILEHEIAEGTDALERSRAGLFLSGFSAGLDIGFSLLLMAVIRTLTEGDFSEPVIRLLVANAYPVGFIFVVLGRSELFTEQTTLAVLPVLNGGSSLGALARLWALVYVSNLLGATAFAALVVMIGPALGVIDARAFGQIAQPLVSHPDAAMLAGALLAGWLMGLLSWLVAAGRDTISQIALVWLIAFVIGIAGLNHVVAGSVEVLAAVFSQQGVSLADYGRFLLWTTIGNAIGGSFFVAVIKYSAAIRAKELA